MPTFDLFVKAVSANTAPYSVRRRRVEGGEVSHYVVDTQRYWPGTVPLITRNWRWVRVTDAPAGLGEMLVGPDTLDVDDVGRGFEARRKIWRVRLKTLDLFPRKMPNINAATWSPEEVAALLAFRPALANTPAPARRPNRWDIRVPYSADLFRQKNPEGRDLDGLPVEEGVPLEDEGIDTGEWA